MKNLSIKPWMAAFMATLIILLFFGHWVFHANQYLLATGGDAVKNYYTMAWYLAHDSGWWTSGMNYPYGEHIFFADIQPIFSFMIASVAPVNSNPALYTPGIINLLMFLSLVLCAYFLFKILLYFKVPLLWALLTSLLITFLNPQLPRFFAHYSLAHAFIIPMFWWLTIKANKHQKPFIFSALLLMALLFSAMIQIYFLVIGAAFVMIFTLAVRIIKKPIKKISFIAPLSAAVLSLVLFKLLILVTDPVSDRSISPYGFIGFRHIPATLLFKQGSDFMNAFGISALSIENKTYLGLAVAIMAITGFLMFISKIIKNKSLRIKIENPVMAASLIAAIVLLVFSMAIPFIWFPQLLDRFPVFNQFRACGRFAWPFYYVMAVYAMVLIKRFYQILFDADLKSFAWGILALFWSVWGFEVFLNLRMVYHSMPQNKSTFLQSSLNQTLKNHAINADDFQAILPLPYYNIGSEKLYISNSNKAIYESCRASIALGLPIITTHLSRTSISQSFKEAQLLSGPMIKKTIVQDLPNQKPILVLSCSDALKPYEQSVIDRSTLIAHINGLSLFSLKINDLQDQTHQLKLSFNAQKDSLIRKGMYFLSDSQAVFIYRHFDHTNFQDYTFAGRSSLYHDKGNLVLLDTLLSKTGYPNPLIVSFWMHYHPQRPAFPLVHWQLWDQANTLIANQYINPKEGVEIYNEWLNISFPLQHFEAGMRFKLEVQGDKAIVDELLIQKQTEKVWYQNSTGLFYNNYPL